MICNNCNSEVRDTLKFCPNCGAKIASPVAPETQPFRGRLVKPDLKKSWKPFIWLLVAAAALYGGIRFYAAYNAQAGFKLGEHRYRIGEYKQGAEILEKVVRANPRLSKAWVVLAKCYREQGLKNRTVYTAERALRWNRNSSELYSILGEIYYQKKDMKKARENLEKSIKLEPGARAANQYLGFIYIDTALKERAVNKAASAADESAAVKYLEKALKGAPRTDRIDINNTLGDIYLNRKNYSAAEKAYLAALKDNMNLIDTSLKLIEVYLKLGKYTDAKREIDRAVQIDPGNKYVESRKIEVYEQIRKIETIDYIMKRKSLDEAFMDVYAALKSYIDRMNANPNAFLGREDQELAQMKEDATTVANNYKAMRSPQDYYLVHTQSLNTSSTIIDIINTLQDYVRAPDDEKYKLIYGELDNLKKLVDKTVATWKREEDKLNISAMIKDAQLNEQAMRYLRGEDKPEPMFVSPGSKPNASATSARQPRTTTEPKGR